MKQIYVVLIICIFNLITINAQTTTVVTEISFPYALELNGNDLYIGEFFENKISKIDITQNDPTITTVVTGVDTPTGLAINGNDLYISSDDRILKIDITESTPTLTTVVSGLVAPEEIVISGNYLYVAELIGKISRIDISEPVPTITLITANLNNPEGLALSGDNLYFTENPTGTISKIDLTDSSLSVIPVASTSNFFPTGIVVSGNDLYIAADTNTISKIDISESSPLITTVLTDISAAQRVVANDEFLYISEFLGDSILKYPLPLLSTQDITANKTLAVLPNPVKDYISISNLSEKQNYVISNELGQVILKGTISNNEKIDISDFSSGLYFMTLENSKTLKILKK